MEKRKRSKVQVGTEGRVVIPAHIRKQLGIEPGEELIVRVDDGRIVMEKPEDMIRRVQEMFEAKVPPGVSLVDELIAERREEARREALLPHPLPPLHTRGEGAH